MESTEFNQTTPLIEAHRFQWSAEEYLKQWLPLFDGVDDNGEPHIPVDPIYALIQEKAKVTGFEADWNQHVVDWKEDKVIIYKV